MRKRIIKRIKKIDRRRVEAVSMRGRENTPEYIYNLLSFIRNYADSEMGENSLFFLPLRLIPALSSTSSDLSQALPHCAAG